VNSRALQQRDRLRWSVKGGSGGSGGPGLLDSRYTRAGGGTSYQFQESSSSRLGSIARERGLGLKRDGERGCPPRCCSGYGRASHVLPCGPRRTGGGGGGEEEQVPGEAALRHCSRRTRRSPDEGVGGGRWACRRLSPWGCGILDRGPWSVVRGVSDVDGGKVVKSKIGTQ
jgi:hypothetical protein